MRAMKSLNADRRKWHLTTRTWTVPEKKKSCWKLSMGSKTTRSKAKISYRIQWIWVNFFLFFIFRFYMNRKPGYWYYVKKSYMNDSNDIYYVYI